MIHPTAIVHPDAVLDPSVRVGPYAIVDEHVQVGPDCIIGSSVYLTGHTTIGPGNRFFHGAVIGEAPQDLKYKGAPSRLRIGARNTFREHVTVNRSTLAEHETVIGTNCLLMSHAHVAHDVVLGDHVILAGGALLAGHVVVGDRSLVSGNCLVHQFVRIGTLAMMRGGTAISKDLPPFTNALGTNTMCGLNVIGLRRAGFPAEDRLELKQLYRALFRGEQNLGAAIAAAQGRFKSPAAKVMLDFLSESKRGVCSDRGARRHGELNEEE